MDIPNSGDQYNLKWNNHLANFVQTFVEHQHGETLVDVTLSCEGQYIKTHKLILSACSDYFHSIFQVNYLYKIIYYCIMYFFFCLIFTLFFVSSDHGLMYRNVRCFVSLGPTDPVKFRQIWSDQREKLLLLKWTPLTSAHIWKYKYFFLLE